MSTAIHPALTNLNLAPDKFSMYKSTILGKKKLYSDPTYEVTSQGQLAEIIAELLATSETVTLDHSLRSCGLVQSFDFSGGSCSGKVVVSSDGNLTINITDTSLDLQDHRCAVVSLLDDGIVKIRFNIWAIEGFYECFILKFYPRQS